MSLETIKASLPDYARDLRLNIDSLAKDETLSASQKAGTFVACAIVSREASLIDCVMQEFGPALSPEALNAAKAAAAIMGMNNIYYRFTHLTSNHDYAKLPAKLRMNIIANPGVAKADFELWCLAVSAINGCGACIDSHEKVLRDHGFSLEQVQTAARIAAVVHAVSVVLESEAVLKTAMSPQEAA